jgi:hypothetical protein
VGRRKKAHVPEDIDFKIEPQIALEQIPQACGMEVRRGAGAATMREIARAVVQQGLGTISVSTSAHGQASGYRR